MMKNIFSKKMIQTSFGLFLASLLGSSVLTNTYAAAFPEKAVTIVVTYPAGGATDVIARLIAEKLPAVWGQQVVVTNRPGAGATVAAEALARAWRRSYIVYDDRGAHD